MSINFHAYQSRGYLFENFEVQCEQWRSLFTGYDPVRVSRILQFSYDSEYLYIPYFCETYRLRLENGVLEKRLKNEAGMEKKENDKWTDQLFFNETMSIYHLLYYVKDVPVLSGNWILNEHLDERRRSGKVNDILLDSFSTKFSGRCKDLRMACEILSGIPLEKGDVSYEFEVFPQVKIRLVFWDKDEDFPAQTQVYVDARITDYVHVETTGCIVSDLLEKLEKADACNNL